MNDTIFVTGAAGPLGQLVIKHLIARGVHTRRIIAGTRHPEKLADLAAAGIDVRKADFDDLAGLTEAFRGAGTSLIISTDTLDGRDTRLKQHGNAVAAAVAAGVGRLAYTSMLNPASSLVSFAPDHRDTEQAIIATGLPHVIFRNCWYHENLVRTLPNALRLGQWHSAAEGGRISYISREDIAESIAAALVTRDLESRTYTLTGAQALSTDEVARLASEATNKPLSVVHVTDAQLAAGLVAAGIPEVFVALLVSIEKETRAGNLSIVTDHVERLLGRKSKRLADYFQETEPALWI